MDHLMDLNRDKTYCRFKILLEMVVGFIESSHIELVEVYPPEDWSPVVSNCTCRSPGNETLIRVIFHSYKQVKI